MTGRPRVPWPRIGLLLCIIWGAVPGHAQELRAGVATRADPRQQYDLSLPAGYPGTRRWPVLIILDPRGRADRALEMAQPAAAMHGWIVMSSHQSRSDDREQLTLDALQALLREAGTHYASDPRRIYLAGMSGTAKSLWTVERPLHGLIAGYIGAGGGRPAELGALASDGPAYFGFAGTRDFNHREMRELDDALARAGSKHRLAIFDGPHGWPPPAQFAEAIDWLELQAMRDGRAPRREAWIDAQLVAARARAALAVAPLEHWRALEQLARDFSGLRDVSTERGQADSMAASEQVRAALKLERRLLAEEARFAHSLDDWATRLRGGAGESGRLPPPDTARTLSTLRIASLRERSHDAKTAVADSSFRRLELAYAAGAHYLADESQRRGDLPATRAALAFAAAVFPDRDYPACRISGLAKGTALEEGVAACGSTPVMNAR